jgi:hypothetical protein
MIGPDALELPLFQQAVITAMIEYQMVQKLDAQCLSGILQLAGNGQVILAWGQVA